MNTRLTNIRLAFSTAFSLLIHVFAFFSLSFFLQFHLLIPVKNKTGKLEVRLAQTRPSKVQHRSTHKLLSTAKPSPFKVKQAPIQNPPVIAPPEPVVEHAPQTIEGVAGIAFPGSIATPFPGQGRSNNSLFQPRIAQQNAAQTYLQQAMEAQARQRSEQQAQLLLQQLHQMLTKLLDAQAAVSGKCVLAESGESQKNILKCDSTALHEALNRDQQNVAWMLITLRGMGSNINGFSVERSPDKSGILFIHEE